MSVEPILEPGLPIVDPHHHLWDRRNYAPPASGEHPFITAIAGAQRYLLDELVADTGSGPTVIATVFVECGSFYKADGPAELRPVVATAFVNVHAAKSSSGASGDMRAWPGLLGRAAMLAGDARG